MNGLSKLMVIGLVGSLVTLPVLGARTGWGLPSERDAKIIAQSDQYCPPSMRRANGQCQRSHRSYYFGRSHAGGGPHAGK